MKTSYHMLLTIINQWSGLAESSNKILIRIIKKTTGENKGSCSDKIKYALWMGLFPFGIFEWIEINHAGQCTSYT